MQTQESPPTSLRELASTLFIYKGTILFVTLLFCGGAALVSLIQSKLYESSVQIWAQDQSAGLRGSSNYPTDSAARVKMALTNVREVIFSRQVLESALEQCGMLDPSPTNPTTAQQAARDRMVARLNRSIRLDAPKGTDLGNTQIFYIRLRNQDPERSRQLLSSVLESFRRRYEQLSAEQAQHLYKETTIQVEKSREQLQIASEAFDECVQSLEGGMAELNSMGGAAGGESELRRSLVQLNERLVPAEAELKVQQSLLQQLALAETDTEELINLPGSLIRDYPSLEQVVRELRTARSQFDAVAARLTPLHAEFQRTEEYLRLVEQSYRSEVERASSAIKREIEAKFEAVEFMRRRRDHYLERIAELTNRFVEFDGLRQEMAQRRTIVADAERRRSDAAHALLTAAQETLFATLDGPRTSTNPVSPQRKLNVAVGTMLGLMTGIGLAFLSRQFSQIVRSETDLAGIADQLVVVSVPKVRSPLQMVS